MLAGLRFREIVCGGPGPVFEAHFGFPAYLRRPILDSEQTVLGLPRKSNADQSSGRR